MVNDGIKNVCIPDLMYPPLLLDDNADNRSESIQDNTRVAVLGACEVGKTATINSLMANNYTINNNHLCVTIHRYPRSHTTDSSSPERGRHFKQLEMIDTRGPAEKFLPRNEPLLTADCYMLVYAVDDEESFETVIQLRHSIVALREIVVVANKADLPAEEWRVSSAIGEALVDIEWGHAYVEISAAEEASVELVMRELLAGRKKQRDANGNDRCKHFTGRERDTPMASGRIRNQSDTWNHLGPEMNTWRAKDWSPKRRHGRQETVLSHVNTGDKR